MCLIVAMMVEIVMFRVQLIECLMSLRADVMHHIGIVDTNKGIQYSPFIVCQPR